LRKYLLATLVLTFCGVAFATSGLLPVEKQYEFALWNLHNYGQAFRIDQETLGKPGLKGADIHILDAWKIVESSPDILVAVIDGGFDLRHPDLTNAYLPATAYNFISDTSVLEIPKEEIDVHANLVAGVIAADGFNKIGITGVSKETRIIPIEAIPGLDQSEKDHDVARAITYAIEQGARVINCSFGKNSTSEEVRSAIGAARKAKVVIIAGAGNEGTNNDNSAFWPANYSTEFDNVISVAASDRLDHLWPESNFGESVDLAAPGHEILSTGWSQNSRSLYFSASGTSMAAPHVTAVAALILEIDPDLTGAEVKKILLDSVDVLPGLKNKVKSGGRLNAAKALRLAKVQRDGHAKRFTCNFDKSKQILKREKNGYTAVWTIGDVDQLSRQTFSPPDAAYADFQKWANRHTKMSGWQNMRNGQDVRRKMLPDAQSQPEFLNALKLDIENSQKMLDGKVGDLRKINCLESIPFREYMKVVDLKKDQMEFAATILRRGSETKIVGDFYKTSDGSGVATSEVADAEIKRAQANGWKMTANLHNHPFVFNNPGGDIGGNTEPSSADIEYYQSRQLDTALITNGLETIVMKKSGYNQLKPK
jgi:hypothetical protein